MTIITLDFSPLITWDLEALVDDVVNWLNHPKVSETSKVGTLSSPRFLDLIQPFVDDKTGTHFHRMMYAISLAYTRSIVPGMHHLTVAELFEVGSMAGHNFLRILDKLLKPQHLRNCSQDQLRSLFLSIFGAILAVAYTEPHSLGNTPQGLAQFKDTRSFLCQILAHYLIYLGSQLKLPIASETEQFILQAAPARWYRQGLFQWTKVLHPKDQPIAADEWYSYKWTVSPDIITDEPDSTSSDSTHPSGITNQMTAEVFALEQSETSSCHTRRYRSPKDDRYGTSYSRNATASDEHSLQMDEESGLWYCTKTADNGCQALFEPIFRTVNIPHISELQ